MIASLKISLLKPVNFCTSGRVNNNFSERENVGLFSVNEDNFSTALVNLFNCEITGLIITSDKVNKLFFLMGILTSFSSEFSIIGL